VLQAPHRYESLHAIWDHTELPALSQFYTGCTAVLMIMSEKGQIMDTMGTPHSMHGFPITRTLYLVSSLRPYGPADVTATHCLLPQ